MMKKKSANKKKIEINVDKVSEKILKEIGSCEPNKIDKLSKKANEFLVLLAFKLAEKENPINDGFTEKQLKPYFERAMVISSMEIFVRKGIIRKTGEWFNPSYVETEFGKLAREEKLI